MNLSLDIVTELPALNRTHKAMVDLDSTTTAILAISVTTHQRCFHPHSEVRPAAGCARDGDFAEPAGRALGDAICDCAGGTDCGTGPAAAGDGAARGRGPQQAEACAARRGAAQPRLWTTSRPRTGTGGELCAGARTGGQGAGNDEVYAGGNVVQEFTIADAQAL